MDIYIYIYIYIYITAGNYETEHNTKPCFLIHVYVTQTFFILEFVGPFKGMWRVWVRREGVYRVLVGKPEGRGPLERPRRRWMDL